MLKQNPARVGVTARGCWRGVQMRACMAPPATNGRDTHDKHSTRSKVDRTFDRAL